MVKEIEEGVVYEPTKEGVKKLYKIWRDNLIFFVEDFLAEHLTSEIPNFHHELYNLVVSEQRLCLAAPRGFAKSRICSVFYPLHCALFENKKDICIISASEGLATEWLRAIRTEVETNPLIIKYFGDLRSGKWTESHIILNNASRVSIRARGAEGQIRGFRPDLIVLDDIETEDSVASAERRNKLRNWIFKACLNTLLPHGQFIWIGTIISQLALLEEQLKTDNGWKKKRYQAYIDGIQSEGHELWPALWPHNKLQERKMEIGSSAFASEYLNNPIANESAPIKPYHIKYYDEAPENMNIVIAVDPAYSDDDRADFKVATAIGIDARNNRYLLEYIRTHRPSGEFIDSFLNMYLKYVGQVTALGVPNAGTEKEFYNSVVRRTVERGLAVSITPLKNAFQRGGDKVVRRKKDRIVAALQPLFEQGKYFLKTAHVECIDELLAIGATRNDDVVDTLCYAEQLFAPGMEVSPGPTRDRYGTVVKNPITRVANYGY